MTNDGYRTCMADGHRCEKEFHDYSLSKSCYGWFLVESAVRNLFARLVSLIFMGGFLTLVAKNSQYQNFLSILISIGPVYSV